MEGFSKLDHTNTRIYYTCRDFSRNKFRGGKSSLSKIEGAEL